MSTRISTRDSGTALNFDGSSDIVTIPNSTQYDSAVFSIAGWLKPNPLHLSGGSNMVAYRSNIFTTANNGWYLRFFGVSGKNLQFGILGPVETTLSSTTVLVPNKWTYFVATYDGSIMRIYLDGVLNSSSASGKLYTPNIGASLFVSSTGSGIKAVQDEFRVFNSALSDTEVSNLYFNNVVPRTGLVGEWLFNEGSGTTALDTSGNGNNGTITGATYTTDVPFKPRVASTNKTAVQPMNASLNFSATTDKVDCGTDFIGTGDVTVSGWINPRTIITANGRIISNNKYILRSVGGIIALVSEGATSASSGGILQPNRWYFLSVTRTSTGITNFRINNTSSGTANQSSGTPVVGTSNTFIGNDSGALTAFPGKLKDLKVFNRILTTSEQDALMSGINPTDYSTSIVRDFSLNEGAGTIVYSKNNPALTGTITGATWSSDTPTKARNQVGGNLVKNGDLSYVPVVNVVQTTTNWIDGTSTGSATNSLFNLYFRPHATVATALVDTTTKYNNFNSIKLSTLDATGIARVSFQDAVSGATYGGTKKYLFNLLPNTSYTLSAYVKTNNVATSSAFIQLIEVQGDASTVGTTNQSNKLTGTNDWTLVTSTFTTASTTRFSWVWLLNGVAGNISDAWFANITLTPTTPVTRVVV